MCYSIFSSVCLQAFTLPHPLHFYCLYRQRVATGAQVVISKMEYIPVTSVVCRMHMLSVIPSQALYYILNVFLWAPRLLIVFCAVLPCPRPCLKWQPSSPSEGRTKKAVYPGTSAPRYACKQTWLASECFLSLQAPTSIPGSLPRLTSFQSKDVFIINLVPSLFLAVLVFFLIFK